MNHDEVAKNNMYKEMIDFFDANAAKFAAFARANTEVGKFVTNNEKLDGYIQQQAGETQGATNEKDTVYVTLVGKTVKASRKALVYAIDQENETLKNLFNVQEADFTHVAKAEGLAKIENVFGGLEPLSGTLDAYRVTATEITAIGAAITNYEGVQGEPGTAAASKRAGTEGIKATMPLMDGNLDILDDLVIHGMDDDPDFVNEYRACRRIHEVGTRHTGLNAIINDSVTGMGIEGALMRVDELNKQATSSILGEAKIPSMRDGVYNVTFSAPGYVSQTLMLTIERGRTLEITVALVKS